MARPSTGSGSCGGGKALGTTRLTTSRKTRRPTKTIHRTAEQSSVLTSPRGERRVQGQSRGTMRGLPGSVRSGQPRDAEVVGHWQPALEHARETPRPVAVRTTGRRDVQRPPSIRRHAQARCLSPARCPMADARTSRITMGIMSPALLFVGGGTAPHW